MFEELAALHDPVTRLPGAVLFFDRLRVAQSRAARNQTSVAVLAVELESFTALARGYGGRVAHELLCEAACRLVDALGRDRVSAAADGGFLVMCDDLDGVQSFAERETEEYARRCTNALGAPYHVGGMDVDVRVRIGTEVNSDGTLEPLAFIQAALAHRPAAAPRRTVQFG